MAVNFLVALRVTEYASGPLRRAAEAGNQMADAADRLSTQSKSANYALIGFAAATDAAVGAMAAQAAQLEQSLARLATVTRTTTSTQESALKDAENAARDFSTQWTASAKEVITAQFEIATAGIAVDEQIVATQSAFKLARATMGDFTQSAQLLGSFLNTFGKSAELNYLNPADKMQKITDILSTSVQRFQVTLPVLAESFKFIVGPASTLELKLSEVSAALGILNTAGFRGTLAGTALSNMFNKLDRAVEKLNLDPEKFIDLNGNLKDLASFLDEVNRALADKTPIEQQNTLIDVFDIRAGRVAKTLLNTTEAIRQFGLELEISRGATEAMAKQVESTTSAEFQKFLNTIQNISTSIGGDLNVAFKSIIVTMKDFLVGIAEFVQAHSTTLAVIIGLEAALVTFAAITATASIAVGALSKALVGLAATSTTAAIAFKALQAAILIGKIVAIVTAVAAAGYLFGEALGWIYNKLFGVNEASKVVVLTMREVDEIFASNIQKTARYTAELERLGKTLKGNVKLPLGPTESLGSLPFAQSATNALRSDPTIGRPNAIKEAVDAIGGAAGIIREVSEAMNENVAINQQYFESFVQITSATDRQFKSLNQVEVAQGFYEKKISGTTIALMQMANQSQGAAEAIKVLIETQGKLNGDITKGVLSRQDRQNLTNKAFEAIKQSIDSLLTSNSKVAQDVAKAFQANQVRLGEAFNAASLDFYGILKQIPKLDSELKSLSYPALQLAVALKAVENPVSQLQNSVKSVENQFKNAALGGESFAKAFEKSQQNIDDATKSLESFNFGIEFAKKNLELFGKNGLLDTPEGKQLQKFIDDAQEIEIQFRAKIDEAQVTRETNRIFALIDRENKTFTAQQVKDITQLGSAFASTIGNALTGQLKGISAFTSLADQFKQQFVGEIQKGIGEIFGDRFKNEFRTAIVAAGKFIEQEQLSGKLFEDFSSGDLAKKINDVVHGAVPNLEKITGGDIFNITKDNKLAEQFNSVFTDASVAMVNAGNRSAALLEQLQSVIGEGPGRGVQELTQQATQLRDLLQRAGSAGATDAIRPIEQALSAVLSQLREEGPGSAVQQIANATQAATGAIDTSAGRFASSVLSSAQQFVEIISEGFKRIKDGDIIKAAGSLIDSFGKSDKGSSNIKVETTGGALNVNVQGSGSTVHLDEDEIRKIVSETRTELLREVDDKINKLENHLRGR